MKTTKIKFKLISNLHMGDCRQSLLLVETVLLLSGLSTEKQTLHCMGNSSHLCHIKKRKKN